MGRVTKRSGRNGTSFHAVGGQELSELAGFEHLADDVAAAHELAFHIELWNCRPVGEPFDPLSQRRIAEHVDTLELDAEMAQHLHHDGRETALREDRRAFHKQHNIVVIDFALDARLYWILHRFDLYLFPVRGGPALGEDRARPRS